MKHTFTVVVERDPKSSWLVGEVVELPGCSTQAPDLPTLEANMHDAIRAYLQHGMRTFLSPALSRTIQIVYRHRQEHSI